MSSSTLLTRSVIRVTFLVFLTGLAFNANSQTVVVDEKKLGEALLDCAGGPAALDGIKQQADRAQTALAINCAFYARLKVHTEGRYLTIPSTADAVAVRDAVAQLQSDFSVKFDKLAKDFNDNFIRALTCANSINADIRKASNCP